MHIWETRWLQLSATGLQAPAADEIISAEFTYGGGGSCQSATIRPIDTASQGRDAEWLFSLSGTPVFRGIPDSISDSDGQLAQIGLMASHRPRLGALGAGLGGIQAGPYETLSTALERELGGLPAADIGIRPDGIEVAGVPSGGEVYTLDERAYDLRHVGPTYPDAVTDAVFDAGEGWEKYVYQRHCPPYALRRAGQARADPVLIDAEDSPEVVLHQDLSGGGVFATPIWDGQPRVYRWFGATYRIAVPPDDTTKKNVRYTLRFNISPTVLPVGHSVEVKAALFAVGAQLPSIKVQEIIWPEGEGGLVKGITFELTESDLKTGATLEFRVIGLTRHPDGDQNRDDVQVVFHPLLSRRTYKTPNVAAVKMPEGWGKPFRTEPRFEFRLIGWHLPPFVVAGLPGGGRTQAVASATVTWNKNECSTLITTEAAGYGR